MNDATRDAIGRALYEACADFYNSRTPEWKDILDKEKWILRASKVVEAYKEMANFDSGSPESNENS